jgi:hypothetical protein
LRQAAIAEDAGPDHLVELGRPLGSFSDCDTVECPRGFLPGLVDSGDGARSCFHSLLEEVAREAVIESVKVQTIVMNNILEEARAARLTLVVAVPESPCPEMVGRCL